MEEIKNNLEEQIKSEIQERRNLFNSRDTQKLTQIRDELELRINELIDECIREHENDFPLGLSFTVFTRGNVPVHETMRKGQHIRLIAGAVLQ